jgi:hypothetical protein
MEMVRDTIKQHVEQVYVVAYREDTRPLEAALRQEGLPYTVLRATYSGEQLEYSRTVRCLLNHKEAWTRCLQHKGLCMVVEADFVPVVGLANLPLPFDIGKRERVWGWCYAGGPRLYEFDERGFARGHAACPVATIMGPQTAKVLIDFAENEMRTHDPRNWSGWDCAIQHYALSRGIQSFIPFRNYGEHGGLPNPEHGVKGITPTHQAEALMGRLHFLPMYAKGSLARYVYIRAKAKLRGFARILVGRFVEPGLLRKLPLRLKLEYLWYGIVRLLSVH